MRGECALFNAGSGRAFSDVLGIPKGITAIIGSGGKTTLMMTLAGELKERGTVIVTTSTNIRIPEEVPHFTEEDPEELKALLAAHRVVCVGTPVPGGKFATPSLSYSRLADLADYVLVEADGSRGLPLKAHASYEPVIPENAARTVNVAGLTGIGHPIREMCHRPELYTALSGRSEDETVTPEIAADVLSKEGLGDVVFLNQADSSREYRIAEKMAERLACPVFAGSLRKGEIARGRRSMLVLIRGAGDLATGIGIRLIRSGFKVIMTEVEMPTVIRRTVAFAEAVRKGSWEVEGIEARRADDASRALEMAELGIVPVLVDPELHCLHELRPDVLIDAILAKKNLGTRITDASLVIGVGPGFTAGTDCHAVVETMRGHTLGRVYYEGSALPNTNVPGRIGGFAGERVLRAPSDGVFISCRKIGDIVREGEVVGYSAGKPMVCTIGGVLRGLLSDGVPVRTGMKAGDVDPRGKVEYCYTCSDKAIAIGGGVLEAILHLSGMLRGAM